MRENKNIHEMMPAKTK